MNRFLCLILILILMLSAVPALAYEELAKGSKGDAVIALQERLKELGYYSISVDGDYGNGTLNAVSAFQSRNGIDATGIATAETQELLYSDNAKPAPPTPDVEVTSVKKDGAMLTCTFKNNTAESITGFTYCIVTYTSDGRISGSTNKNIDLMEEETFGCLFHINERINAGKSKTYKDNWSDFKLNMHDVVAIGVKDYTFASGETYQYSYEQMTFRKSDGGIIYPLDENAEFRTLSAEDEARANTILFGFTTMPIPYYLSSYYMRPAGSYCVEISNSSIAENAGLQLGDVLISFDDDGATKPFSAEYAKLKMLDGEDVVVEYWRNNNFYETTFSLNSRNDEVTDEESPNNSVADELLKYAELLEKGLITQEEFDQFKEKLLAQ